MRKIWYFTFIEDPQTKCKFLNVLRREGLAPAEIKINGDEIYYFHSESIRHILESPSMKISE